MPACGDGYVDIGIGKRIAANETSVDGLDAARE